MMGARALSSVCRVDESKGTVSMRREDGWKGEWTLEWLQDNCRCKDCFEIATHQRLSDTLSFAPVTNFRNAEVTEKAGSEELIVHSDKHTLRVPLSSLRTEDIAASSSPLSAACWKPFVASSVEWGTPVASAQDILAGDKNARRAWAQALWVRGFAIVSGLNEGNESELRKTVEALFDGQPQHSMFGDTWDIPQLDISAQGQDEEWEIEHRDTAYINVALEAHTDGCYSAAPPGVQFFQIPLPATNGGGENFLVDGLAVAQSMRQHHPEHFETLCRIPVPYRYLDAPQGLQMEASWPVFRCDPATGHLLEFHWNNADRSPLPHLLRPTEQRQFLEAIKALIATIRQPELNLIISLQPDWLLGVNNWRIMHGRNEFHGERRLMGAYVTRDTYDICRSRLV